jgi:hypothetical protein
MGQAAGEQPRRASVGLGRIVVSETEAPNLLGTLGMKRMGGRTQQCSWPSTNVRVVAPADVQYALIAQHVVVRWLPRWRCRPARP